MGGRDTSNGGVFLSGDGTFPSSYLTFFFVNVEDSDRALQTFHWPYFTCLGDICALHPFKGLIFTASVCVNKMAFLERGCGEPTSVGTCFSFVVSGGICKNILNMLTDKHGHPALPTNLFIVSTPMQGYGSVKESLKQPGPKRHCLLKRLK